MQTQFRQLKQTDQYMEKGSHPTYFPAKTLMEQMEAVYLIIWFARWQVWYRLAGYTTSREDKVSYFLSQ